MNLLRYMFFLGLLTFSRAAPLAANTQEEFFAHIEAQVEPLHLPEAPVAARRGFLNILHSLEIGIRGFIPQTEAQRIARRICSNSATAPADEPRIALTDQELLQRSIFLNALIANLCTSWGLELPRTRAERDLGIAL